MENFNSFILTMGPVDQRCHREFPGDKDTLKLKSDKEVGKDFTVTAQSKQEAGIR